MSSLHVSDILKIYKNFEASRLKIWEIVRTYDPVDFAKLIYLLENVRVRRKRYSIDIGDERLYGKRWAQIIAKSEQRDISLNKVLENGDLNDDPDDNRDILPINHTPNVRLERAVWKDTDILWYSNPNAPNIIDTLSNENRVLNNGGCSVSSNSDHIQQQKQWLTETIERQRQLDEYENRKSVVPADSETNPLLAENLDVGIGQVMRNIRNETHSTNMMERIISHNLGTDDYNSLLKSIRYLLFTDNLQSNRSQGHVKTPSIVESFMQFYRMLLFREAPDNADPRAFRFMVLPKPRRVFVREMQSIYGSFDGVPKNLRAQPLFQGVHMVVYSSKEETKCYNRFGDLYTGFGYNLRCKVNCTFEAIALPVDKFNNVRSWHYWKHRASFVLFVVDVFRVNQTILTQVPFKERIRMVNTIIDGASDQIKKIPDSMDSWESIEGRYIQNEDIYDPIVGVVLRDGDSIFDNDSALTCPVEYRFNLIYSFDLLNGHVVRLKKEDDINRLHLIYEMADYKTVCLAYGHSEDFIYLCQYNRHIHQFEHAGRLVRQAYEFDKLEYKAQKLYVINCRVMPRGIIYLRVYYDAQKRVIGYDTKWSDSRYTLPYFNSLYACNNTTTTTNNN